MTLTITPSKLTGKVTPPPSKSQAHRLLIAAALAGEGSGLRNLADSQDIQATRRCLEELGPWQGPMSPLRRLALPRLDCGESGSTLRFLIPVALALRGGGIFTGRGRLMERPQQPYFDLFREKGIFYQQKDGTLTVQGLLSPGKYELPGNVSSQFVTGLLYALPLLEGDSCIVPTTPVESWDYILMTLDALRQAGIVVEAPREGSPCFLIPGNQTYRPIQAAVEPDWSQAGFWFAAGALGNPVEVEGMKAPSLQGDWRYLELQEQIFAAPQARVDMSQNPALLPPPGRRCGPGRRPCYPLCQRGPTADQGERPPPLGHHSAQRPGGRGGGGGGLPPRPRKRGPIRRGDGGRLQRPPHRHDDCHRRHPLQVPRHPHRRGERKQILPQLLGGIRPPGRENKE